MKRLFDILPALILIIISLPLCLVIIVLILIFSPGPPLFLHRRIGLGGKEFTLVKFRTMNRSKAGDMCITVEGDERITGIGKLLRKFKLDEFPQLWNILVGDMTFIGPRPESPEYVSGYNASQKEILKYKPGLVDPATLKYRHEERILAQFSDPEKAYLAEVLPDKIDISLQYQKNRGFKSDLMVILKTIKAVFQKR